MLEVCSQDASKFSSWPAPGFSLSSHCDLKLEEQERKGAAISFCEDVKPTIVAPIARDFLSLVTSYKLCLPTLSHLRSAYSCINCQEHPDPKSVRSSLLICSPSQTTEGFQILSFTFHNQFHKIYKRRNHLHFKVDSYF